MEYDLVNYARNMDPIQQQMMLAEVMKKTKRGDDSEALAAANKAAHRFDNLAAVSHLINNPSAVEATQVAQKSSVAANKPTQLGQTGFMLPGTGQFVESPMYADERQAGRDAISEGRRMAIDAQAQRAHEANQLKETLLATTESGRNERAAADRVLRLTLGELKLGQAAAKNDDAKAKVLDTNTMKYSQALEKAAIPEFDTALQIAEGRLAKHPVGKLPGYGEIGSLNPGYFQPEVQMAREDMQAAANILLKSRSGAAVTDSEMRRFLLEVSMGKGMSETALRHGWENVRRQFDAKRMSIAAGASPDVHDEFIRRGGKDFRYVTPADAGKPVEESVSEPLPAGVTPSEWKHMTPEERKLFK